MFLDAVRVKLFASDSKRGTSPKALVSRPHRQDGTLAIQMPQMPSRQPPFLAQNKYIMNRDLSDFSADSAGKPSSSGIGTASRRKSIGMPFQRSSMIRSDDSYETPKFDRFKSQASSSLNKDLFTVRRPPPKKQVKKKPQ